MLESISGTLIGLSSERIEASGAQAVADVYLKPPGKRAAPPAVAQVSLSNFNNTTGASAWVVQVNANWYWPSYSSNSVASASMARVTFVLNPGYPAGGDNWAGDNWAAALVNIFVFGAGASISETP